MGIYMQLQVDLRFYRPTAFHGNGNGLRTVLVKAGPCFQSFGSTSSMHVHPVLAEKSSARIFCFPRPGLQTDCPGSQKVGKK